MFEAISSPEVIASKPSSERKNLFHRFNNFIKLLEKTPEAL